MIKRLFMALVLLSMGMLAGIAISNGRAARALFEGQSVKSLALQVHGGNTNAVATLRAQGDRAVPELVDLLQARDSFWRKQAWGLAPKLPYFLSQKVRNRIAPPNAAKLRSAAARSLGVLGKSAEAAIPELTEAMRDPDVVVRWDVATALGQIGASAVPSLAEALQDKDPNVRLAAAYGLGQIGPAAQSAGPALVEKLQDPDAAVRNGAATSLSRMGSPTLRALAKVIERGNTNAQAVAVKILLQHHTALRVAAGPLRQMAQAPAPAARRQAIEALGILRMGDEATMQCLLAALKDPAVTVRVAAVEALGRVGLRSAGVVSGLRACQQDEATEVREAAARVLGSLGTGSIGL